jgi:uncharacterized membrane-anchored protein
MSNETSGTEVLSPEEVDALCGKQAVKENLTVAKKKSCSAKEVSKWSMIVGAVWIGALSLLKALWALISTAAFGLQMWEIIFSGVVMASIFTPVYFSIILDKIKDIKLCGKE